MGNSAWVVAALSLAACGDDSGGGGSDAGGPDADIDAPPGARPHPVYPAFDLDTLPGAGGGAIGPYEPPMLPTTTRTVMVSTTGAQARADLQAACQTAGTAVSVANGAGRLGTVDLGNVTDCDITLGAEVVVDMMFVGHLPGPQVAPAHRVRIRGGQIGSINIDYGSSDVVFDGVVINNAVLSPATRTGTAIQLMNAGTAPGQFVERVAFVNSVIRLMGTVPDGAGNIDGCAYLAGNARNLFFANNNVVTAGNRNSWGFRIGGGHNYVFVDNSVRVSFHKLIRMNDGAVDYVYVKGGTWMREATLSAGGLSINDSWAQLGDLGTDHIYIHDPAIHLLSADGVGFGASNGPGQVGKSWEARRIHWYARAASVVSDTTLMNFQSGCAAGATCDYGIGTHMYSYDTSIAFPSNPWRTLPTIAEDNPDNQPIAP